MNKKSWISTLAVSMLFAGTLSVPATASADDVFSNTSARVSKAAGVDADRRHPESYRKVGRWSGPRHGHRPHRGHRPFHRHEHKRHGRGHRHHKRRHGHRHGPVYHRHDKRHHHRPARRHHDRRHKDGVRVSIEYDFWL